MKILSLIFEMDVVDKKFSNDVCSLRFHKQSLRGSVQDYIIDFHETEYDIEMVVGTTMDLFIQLMKHFENRLIKARLIAEISYIRTNDSDESTIENFHFTSYAQEYVDDPEDFYERHMQKIVSRMDTFHLNGSNLLINKINHIHIAITKVE